MTLARGMAAWERAALVAACSGGDRAVRQRLEALLEAQEFAQNSPPPASKASEQKGDTEVDQENRATEAIPQIFGRYSLKEQLGEGGYGVVYVADQTEPVRREVALKVIRLGMETQEVVARFESERQALAMMDHPNIPKVLDAGVTETGRPFFVMELVHGVRITDYCDEAGLGTRERIKLFIQVCHAVQHAHQKGIIHRDIKPSNILVAQQEGQPVPKVIDFGIAKPTAGPLTDNPIYTLVHQFIGTPAYMSPEQADMSGLDIDTRSDVYSLGVLLYELLTGSTPFDGRELVALGIDGMRRRLREQDPVRPSTRLASFSEDKLTLTAKRRSLGQTEFLAQLEGDLDWIVMKCLEKDRSRRYDTANGLAADLKRYLNNEVVTARPASKGYKVLKFIQRNRQGVLVAAAIVLLLVVGIAVTTWLALVATRSGKLAAREAVRSAEVAVFLKDMLESAGPARARGRDTTMLREILDTAAQRVGNQLKNQPEVEFELSSTIGRTYLAVGSYVEAEKLQRSALDLAKRLYGPRHTNVVMALEDLGGLLNDVGRLPEATNVLHEAFVLSRSLVGDDAPLTAGTMRRLGIVYADLGKYAEAEFFLVPAAERLTRLLGVRDPKTLRCRQNLASLYFRQGKLDEMEPVALANLADARAALGNTDPLTLTIAATVALLRQSQGRFEEAEVLHAEILTSKRRILGEDHPNTLLSMDYLAVVLGYEGKFAEAEALTQSALEIAARTGKSESGWALGLRNNHAEHLRNMGRHADADMEFARVLEIARKTTSPNDPSLLETRRSLAQLREFQNRFVEAETILRDVLRIRQVELSADDLDLAETRAHLARILLSLGKAQEALGLAREGLATFEANAPNDWRRFSLVSLVGGCQLALGDAPGAESLLRRGMEGLGSQSKFIPVIDQLRIREALQRLVSYSVALGRVDEARRWQIQMDQFDKSDIGVRLAAARAPQK